MASGRIGKANLTAATNTTVYTTPASTFTVATVSFCNRGNQAIAVRLAVADSATPDDAEYVEYETEILSHGVLERTGLVLAAAQKLVAYSSAANVSVVVTGIETSTA